MDLVKLGNNGIWEREESVIFQAIRDRMLDDGSDQTTQQFAGHRFDAISATVSAAVGGASSSSRMCDAGNTSCNSIISIPGASLTISSRA